MDKTKMDNVINFPPNKLPETEPRTNESSVLDFTWISLAELEEQIISLFPNEETPEACFHIVTLKVVTYLVSTLHFRLPLNSSNSVSHCSYLFFSKFLITF